MKALLRAGRAGSMRRLNRRQLLRGGMVWAGSDAVRGRPKADIEGYGLRFGPGRTRGSRFVTRTLVAKDGRLIG